MAVVIAIQLTNASSVKGFETALATVAGKSSLEIVGTGGVDENVLPALGWLREFGAASPVIEGEMALVMGDEQRARRTEALKVLGVDILRDLTLARIRRRRRARPGPTWRRAARPTVSRRSSFSSC